MSENPFETAPKPASEFVEEIPLDGKYGEKPEEFMTTIQQAIYAANLQEAKNQKLLWDFMDWKAAQESKRLSKISRWIISAWELIKLIGTVKDGEVLAVNNKGEIFKGYANTEKMTALPVRLPERMPSNFDLAEHTYQKMVTKSIAEPTVVSGFKPQWKATTKLARSTPANGILYFFQEIWEERMKKKPEDCSLEIITNSHGEKFTKSSIKGNPVEIVCNKRGGFVGFFFNGKYTEV